MGRDIVPIHFRLYGTSGPLVILLHGGPGAPGYVAPIARELSDSFRVLEPFQRGGGDEPLTVARHVEDLHELAASCCRGERPSLVGHSWGAMLALAYAAAHPGSARSLVLIGCGTFDTSARLRMKQTIEERLGESLDGRMARLAREFPDGDERLAAMGKLIETVDSCDLIPCDDESLSCDERANRETWDDMALRQEQGVYPAAFSGIRVPVIMMHGTHDPHPGRMIRDSLEPHIPQLEYVEWERCGHYPWREKAARDEFYAALRGWLARHAS